MQKNSKFNLASHSPTIKKKQEKVSPNINLRDGRTDGSDTASITWSSTRNGLKKEQVVCKPTTHSLSSHQCTCNVAKRQTITRACAYITKIQNGVFAHDV